ncbi:hypothetical protein [Luteipulveratus halotolerans]|uniref:Uncharacterized protein n=1 Tax=Luteipulveratus halotolerans TaxID=1631356 RepID=A0A0L6CKS5_9MICO|nr:hypothetical protein [Luteipulveratus halotolerans]KNX38118.1 hypothetical protein VV01_14745 [Luteipulveratus halotolerans]
MTIRQNHFDAGTPGANVTQANSGGAGNGDAFTYFDVNGIPAAIQYDTAQKVSGTKSARLDIGASKYAAVGWSSLTAATLAARAYVYLPAAPASSIILIRTEDTSGARDVNVQINADRKIQVDLKGAFGSWAATTALPLATWVRVELYVTKAGAVKCAYYEGSSTTPVTGGSYSVTGAAVGTGSFGAVRFGCAGSYGGSSSYSFYLDALASDDAAADFIGPYVPPAAPTTPIFRLDSGGTLTPVLVTPL